MRIFTIGFSKKSAEHFFNLLRNNEIKQIVDVRLNHNSQISGFAKSRDLKFFLSLFDIGYVHIPEFTPTEDILRSYRNGKISWEEYEEKFLNLLWNRRTEIEKAMSSFNLNDCCLLCSEDKPHKCHRRLVVEFLQDNFIPDLEVKHL